MQKRVSNLSKVIFLGFILIHQLSVGQSFNEKLTRADSLFSAKKYTESLRLYVHLYESEKRASPAMLLKMAYSEEGRQNLGRSLFYLHDYHRLTEDPLALEKMEDLAKMNGLKGYDTTEWERITLFIEAYQWFIFAFLFTMALLLVAMMYRKKQKHGEKSFSLLGSFIFILLLLGYLINFNKEKNVGLVMENQAYLMSGPSAASDLIEAIGEGHKVKILGKEDIWYEIEWQGRRAFLRENKLTPLP